MKQSKKIGNWTIGWYPLYPIWHCGKSWPDDDVDFEICFGRLQILHWRVR